MLGIGRALCATALLVLPASTAAPTTSVPQYAAVHQVVCDEGKGTAFLTNHGWVSVAHVTTLTGCRIDGMPIEGTAEDGLDFATVKVALGGRPLKVNCDGFKTGTYVWAIGYAGGFGWQTMTRHYVTFKDTDDGMRYLLGSPTVIPGMSGGPVLNEQGEVVGTVNRYNQGLPLSYSRALRDTSLCHG